MKRLLPRFFFMLLLSLPLVAGSVISAQCPLPCEDVDQSNTAVVSNTSQDPADDQTSVQQSNQASLDETEPTNSEIDQSNTIVSTFDLGNGNDEIENEQSNETEVNKNNAPGDDAVDQTNLVVRTFDMGNDDDTVLASQTNTQLLNSPDETSGNDTFGSTNTILTSGNLGAGNDLLGFDQTTTIENNSPGDDTVEVSHVMNFGIDAGSGNDTLFFDSQINIQSGGDNPTILNIVVGEIDAGDGDDSVTLRSNQANVSLDLFGSDSLLLDGGDGDDTLTLDYDGGTVSEEEANSIAAYLANNSASGTLMVNGIIYSWVNFEQLVNLILFAIAETDTGGDSAGFTITFTDGRLNFLDVAAPVAIYCANGGFTVWQIDPITGNGTQVIATTLAELTESGPVSGGIATMSLTGNGLVLVTTTTGYSFSFDPALCGAVTPGG